MVTGYYDESSVANFPSLAEKVLSEHVPAGETHVAHIFPPSINRGVVAGEGDQMTEYAASVWDVIDHFCGIKMTEELNGADIHRLENVMTLVGLVRTKFDRLRIWFEETDMPNKYHICGLNYSIKGLPDTITFTTTHPRLSLPDPRYLRVHATCAKVANLSGASECIDKVIWDPEDIWVVL